MTGTFRLMSDISTLAAGAALYQYQGSAIYIMGYNSKKLLKAVQNYSVTELELFRLVVNIYTFKQLLTNVYFEVFCDHSVIVQILNGKKKLPTRRIQKLIEHLLPFNFTVQYLPGNKMHIADILSRLAFLIFLFLYFKPLETIANGYRDYCLKMRTKLDNVSSFITELKTFQQQSQALEKKYSS